MALLTVQQVANELQISRSLAYQEIKSGAIASVRGRRGVAVTTEALQAYIDSRTATAIAQPQPVVYFVRSGGLIKIGFASDFPARLASLRAGCPVPVEPLATMPGTTAEERALHRRFAALRSHSEWFRPGTELIAFIEELR